jgi:hypothetical protein
VTASDELRNPQAKPKWKRGPLMKPCEVGSLHQEETLFANLLRAEPTIVSEKVLGAGKGSWTVMGNEAARLETKRRIKLNDEEEICESRYWPQPEDLMGKNPVQDNQS